MSAAKVHISFKVPVEMGKLIDLLVARGSSADDPKNRTDILKQIIRDHPNYQKLKEELTA